MIPESLVVFFFQAEDGIRDLTVTGVQTCALPISWLIPAAIVLLAVTLLLTFRRPRTDIVRAAFLTWGGVLLLTGAVFSFAQGIIHPYYTVALAPAIGALVGMGAVFLWARRSGPISRLALAGLLTLTAGTCAS